MTKERSEWDILRRKVDQPGSYIQQADHISSFSDLNSSTWHRRPIVGGFIGTVFPVVAIPLLFFLLSCSVFDYSVEQSGIYRPVLWHRNPGSTGTDGRRSWTLLGFLRENDEDSKVSVIMLPSVLCLIHNWLFVSILADSTNSRAYAVALRPSACLSLVCNVLWLNANLSEEVNRSWIKWSHDRWRHVTPIRLGSNISKTAGGAI